jgi:pyridoxamine 5'-phosphate oxidase
MKSYMKYKMNMRENKMSSTDRASTLSLGSGVNQKLKKESRFGELDLHKLHPNPFAQFCLWFQDVLEFGFLEPNAMMLATVNSSGVPSARMVLLKDFDESGFIFFTNYLSQKGKEIERNPSAALVFWWDKLERQIRITGKVEKIEASESDRYFKSRPLESQIGAWVSEQSTVIENRNTLDKKFKELSNTFNKDDIYRPKFWGGYRVAPSMFEFWQGRPNRLHDRFRYARINQSEWKIERLSP